MTLKAGRGEITRVMSTLPCPLKGDNSPPLSVIRMKSRSLARNLSISSGNPGFTHTSLLPPTQGKGLSARCPQYSLVELSTQTERCLIRTVPHWGVSSIHHYTASSCMVTTQAVNQPERSHPSLQLLQSIQPIQC